MNDMGAKVECDLKLFIFGENFFGTIKNFGATLQPNRVNVKRTAASFYYFGKLNEYKVTLKLERTNAKKEKRKINKKSEVGPSNT